MMNYNENEGVYLPLFFFLFERRPKQFRKLITGQYLDSAFLQNWLLGYLGLLLLFILGLLIFYFVAQYLLFKKFSFCNNFLLI